MSIRVVRFTGVAPERVEGLQAELDESEGPPEGVDSTGMQFLYDADQQTAIVIQHFESREKLDSSEAALERMDPSETPGTRASVDRCEVIAEMSA